MDAMFAGDILALIAEKFVPRLVPIRIDLQFCSACAVYLRVEGYDRRAAQAGVEEVDIEATTFDDPGGRLFAVLTGGFALPPGITDLQLTARSGELPTADVTLELVRSFPSQRSVEAALKEIQLPESAQ